MNQKEKADLAEDILEQGIAVNFSRKDVTNIFVATIVANVATVGIFYGMHRIGLLIKDKNETSQV